MFAPPPDAFTRTFESDVPLTFSGEESNGRFRAHAHHSAFRNAPSATPPFRTSRFWRTSAKRRCAPSRARASSATRTARTSSLCARTSRGSSRKSRPCASALRENANAKAPPTKKKASTRRGAPGNASGGRTEAFLVSGTRRLNTRNRRTRNVLSVGSVLEELRGASSLEGVAPRSRRPRGGEGAARRAFDENRRHGNAETREAVRGDRAGIER